jgi:L-amino acid N-acyltransferase YncA
VQTVTIFLIELRLIGALVEWCKNNDNIKSLSGGVESDNIGSIKIMEKTGFSLSRKSNPSDQVLFYEIVFNRNN